MKKQLIFWLLFLVIVIALSILLNNNAGSLKILIYLGVSGLSLGLLSKWANIPA